MATDPINNAAGGLANSLLRAQNAAGLAALKTSQQATQAMINQLQKTAEAGKAFTSQPAPKVAVPASANPNLPRGSLVDILA